MDGATFRSRWGILVLGGAVLGPIAGLMFYGASQAADTQMTVLFIVLGVATLIPVGLGGWTAALARRGRAVVVEESGIRVPRVFRDKVDFIPWSAVQAVEDRTVRVRGIKAARSLLIFHNEGMAEIRESDIGGEAFAKLRGVVGSKVRSPSPEFQRKQRRNAMWQLVAILAAMGVLALVFRALRHDTPAPSHTSGGRGAPGKRR